MKKYDYFYNEQGDYTITKNSEPMAFVSSEKSAKIIIEELNSALNLSSDNEKIESINCLLALKPYVEDLQKENYTDASVGIFEDTTLTKAFEDLQRLTK